MVRLLKITLLTFTVTSKQQPNFTWINICYFDWRTFKLDAFNPDLIFSVCNTSLILIYPTWPIADHIVTKHNVRVWLRNKYFH